MPSLQTLIKRLRNGLTWIHRRGTLALLLLLLLLTLMWDGPPPSSLDTQANCLLAGDRFDFVGWELEAMSGKLLHGLLSPQRYMDEPARHDLFVNYLALVAQIQQVEGQIARTYADPAVSDPEVATGELRARLEELRATQEARQPVAEAILQEQVAGVLTSEGFGALGQAFPLVGARFTPLPTMIVVSPRDHIETIFQLGLRHGITTSDRDAIEAQVDANFNVSSLVTNIGGLAAYPSMLLESSWLDWVVEVTAHEWTHHYLALRPLGWNYLSSPEARTINETVANIVGKEVGRQVVERHYAERLPKEPQDPPAEEQAPPPEPPAFDYRAEMRETRVRVDALLAEGKIDAAEAYMEERRQEFVANGYVIRKLNQAYFAFHGSYADAPGAAGADPIGPAVVDLRARNPDLHTFVSRIARVTTLAEVEQLLQEAYAHP